MLFPLTILISALAAVAATAYGADPSWMLHPHGLDLIMLSRRFQWPLMGAALLCCAMVPTMVAAGRWRVWWLIGLAPVLALFAHRFVTDPARAWQVDAEAQFVPAAQAAYVNDKDWVVGLSFDGEDYAYPYNILYDSPVVAQAKPRRRLLLMWSPFANRAVAAETDWTLKPRELEVVSMPANATLIYNSELGQFINGLTGLTPTGERPTGWLDTVPTVKMTYGQWRQLHPQTKVLVPPDGWRPGGPTAPTAPLYPMPHSPPGGQRVQRVALIDLPHPIALSETDVTAAPLNLLPAYDPLLVLRSGDGLVRAFLRQANGDLTPRFFPVSLPAHPSAALTERDSNSIWTTDGRAVDGPLKGEKLKPFDVDDGVYLNVIAYWYPDLKVIVPSPADVGQAPQPKTAPRHTAHKPRRLRRTVAQVTASF